MSLGSRRHRFPWAASLVVLAAVVSRSLAQAPESPEGIAFFEKKVRPILVNHCSECHSEAAKKTNGLSLETRDALQSPRIQ